MGIAQINSSVHYALSTCLNKIQPLLRGNEWLGPTGTFGHPVKSIAVCKIGQREVFILAYGGLALGVLPIQLQGTVQRFRHSGGLGGARSSQSES